MGLNGAYGRMKAFWGVQLCHISKSLGQHVDWDFMAVVFAVLEGFLSDLPEPEPLESAASARNATNHTCGESANLRRDLVQVCHARWGRSACPGVTLAYRNPLLGNQSDAIFPFASN